VIHAVGTVLGDSTAVATTALALSIVAALLRGRLHADASASRASGGDMISPARVEGYLTLEPEIAQVMVYGDRRPYLVAVSRRGGG
jgi:hypothetical protein